MKRFPIVISFGGTRLRRKADRDECNIAPDSGVSSSGILTFDKRAVNFA